MDYCHTVQIFKLCSHEQFSKHWWIQWLHFVIWRKSIADFCAVNICMSDTILSVCRSADICNMVNGKNYILNGAILIENFDDKLSFFDLEMSNSRQWMILVLLTSCDHFFPSQLWCNVAANQEDLTALGRTDSLLIVRSTCVLCDHLIYHDSVITYSSHLVVFLLAKLHISQLCKPWLKIQIGSLRFLVFSHK